MWATASFEIEMRPRGEGHGAVPALESLPLLTLPQALGHVRADDGPCLTRRIPSPRRRRTDPRVPTGRGRCQGVLLRVRLEPVRRLVARGRRDLDPARVA